jgi:hypothetical protein
LANQLTGALQLRFQNARGTRHKSVHSTAVQIFVEPNTTICTY